MMVIYYLKLMLGWVCFHIWMRLPARFVHRHQRFSDWLLSWAGFYVYRDMNKRESKRTRT